MLRIITLYISISICCIGTAIACDDLECIDFNDINNYPIRIDALFSYVDKVALDICKDGPITEYSLSPEECVPATKKKMPKCRTAINSTRSRIIDNKHIFKEIGYEYLDCIVPGIYCAGIEVRSEEVANLICSDEDIKNKRPHS